MATSRKLEIRLAELNELPEAECAPHLARALHDEMVAHPGQSGFLLLTSGVDAFVARALLAQRAERSIDAQYYLYHDDLTSRLFTDQLLKAADRGVRVRLLIDDIVLEDSDLVRL